MPSSVSQPWKMPPLAKIYEAIGALGDNRVRLESQQLASVVSSDRTKTYRVEVSADGREIVSNDNASYWQGYLGYPAVAVMLLRGLHPVRPEVINALSGIPWKELNRSFRNDYERTIQEVMRRAQSRGFDPAVISAEVDAVLSALRQAAPLRGPRRRPPRHT